MRKVFSSQRLENVESVADLLRSEGIEVKIENGRTWKGHRRGNFSYDNRRAPSQVPAVWIVRAEDQPRGRQLLREMGLLESTRETLPSFLPFTRHGAAAGSGNLWKSKHLRIGLLALIGLGIGLIAFTARKQANPPVAVAKPAPSPLAKAPTLPVPETITELDVHRVDVPTALAVLLLSEALHKRKPAVACLEVDGKDPAPAVLQALPKLPRTRVFAASACPAKGGFGMAVHDYMTDGSGRGQVQLGLDAEDAQLVDVERSGAKWQVLRRH
ncbi:MAG: hypothetical protein KGL91_00445 [Xanthomonadaceae bacterium]|nr:hypothetical protein [Xanthomonadaceae bacterium]